MEILIDSVAFGQLFPPSTLVFACHYQLTDVLHSLFVPVPPRVIILATVSVDIQYASLFLKIFQLIHIFKNIVYKIFKFCLCLIKHCILDAYEEEEV